MAGINRSIVQNNSNYSIDRDTRSNTRLYTIGILLLYAGSFKLDIFGSDSIKISAAMLPRDKCCTKITVAADLVPKVQYILPGPANTPKRCTYYSDTIARTTNAPAGYCVNQIAFRLAPVTLSAKFRLLFCHAPSSRASVLFESVQPILFLFSYEWNSIEILVYPRCE